jgi:hypothetical protein
MADKKKPTPAGLDSTGRYIRFDDRGNAKWKWRTEKLGEDEDEDPERTFNYLKSLENDSLQLEDTFVGKSPVRGRDPYNSTPKKP